MKLIAKLLWQTSGKLQVFGASIGATIGFILLLMSIQFYYDIENIFTDNQDLIKPEYVIINKKLSIFKTLDLTTSEFSKSEISEIKTQDFVKEISPFVANDFRVTAYTDGKSGNIPKFYTELFFEAIPDNFIDINSEDWHWQQSEEVIPIIIPKEYLNLYNFGFAQSQSLPQVSANLIGMVRFNIKIRGNGKTKVFTGKIVGFTNRINSVLVPYNFLNWANLEFGNNKISTSRIIIVAKKAGDPELLSFIQKNNYETNKEKIKSNRLNSLLKASITITSGISIIIIFLSFLVFFVGFQLIIAKSEQKLRKLLHIGYNYLYLSKFYLVFFSILIFLITIIAFLSLNLFRNYISEFLLKYGFEISETISTNVVTFGILLAFILLILNSLSIIRMVRKLS